MTTLRSNDLAVCTETSTSTIREYCDQGVLGPVPRNQSNQYRSFDLRIIPQVYLVRALREMGFTTQQMKEYSENRSPRRTVEMFRRYSLSLRNKMMEMQALQDMLQSYISLIEEGQSARPGTIEVRMLPALPVRLSYVDTLRGKRKGVVQLCRAHSHIRQRGNAGCPLGFAYGDFYDLLEHPDQPAQLVSYDPNGPDVRAAGEYLVGTGIGYYGQMDDLHRRMLDYSLENDLELCGPVYIVYLLDAASVTEAEQYLMQIAVEVRRTANVRLCGV